MLTTMADDILKLAGLPESIGTSSEPGRDGVVTMVTEIPTAEVEVHAKVNQEICGLHMLTAVIPDPQMEVDSHQVEPEPASTDARGKAVSVQHGRDGQQTVYCITLDECASQLGTSKPEGTSQSPGTANTSVEGAGQGRESTEPSKSESKNNVQPASQDESVKKQTKPESVDMSQQNQPCADSSGQEDESGSSPSKSSTAKEALLERIELRGKRQAVIPKEKKSPDKVSSKHMLWCHDCGKSNRGPCRKHGILTIISDSHVASYARLTLPSVLIIQEGPMREGVFARRYVKNKTQFGPLQAQFLSDRIKSEKTNQGFCLKNFDLDGMLCQYDLSNQDRCNWMMFVRPAQTYDEQNMDAYLYDGCVYFSTIKPVEYGKELRVWYASDYAVKIGMSLFNSSTNSLEVNQNQEEETKQEKDSPAGGAASAKNTPLSAEKDGDEVSDSEFVIAHNSDYDHEEDEESSEGESYCDICDTQFRTKQRLTNHTCKLKKAQNKKKKMPGSNKRKGRPRKLPLEIKAEVDEDEKPRWRRGSELKTRNTRSKKAKLEVDQCEGDSVDGGRKKYRRSPKYSCNFCPAQFTSEDPYRIHEASHTGKSAYICDHPGCDRGFDSKFIHWRHMLSHNKPLHRRCPYCDRAFNRLDHLKTHLRTHDQQRFTYLCDICGKSYLHKNAYDFHMAVHDAKEGESLICKICLIEYDSKDDLLKHTLTHNRYKSTVDCPRKHKCHECGKMFATNKDVNRHMVTHTKEKRFLCELCPQTFGRKDHWRRHYRTNHSKEVKDDSTTELILAFSCDLCPQRFAKRKNLTNHLKQIHEPEIRKQIDLKNHPLLQTAEITNEAAVTSSSYNLYELSTPHVNSTTPVQAAKSLERYINTSTSTILTTPQPVVPDATATVTYVNAQPSLPVSIIRNQLSDQLQQGKDRPAVFQMEQVPAQRQNPVPWTYSLLEERDDHSYSTATTQSWVSKVPNFRPGVTAATESEIARILQTSQATQGNFPVQCSNPTLTVAWEAMSDYFAVPPCNNVEVVTSSNMVSQQHHDAQQQQVQQQQQQQQHQHQHQQAAEHLQTANQQMNHGQSLNIQPNHSHQQ